MKKPKTQSWEERFKRRFGIDDDWDNELYQKIPSGWKSANNDVLSFLESQIQTARLDVIEEIDNKFQEIIDGKLKRVSLNKILDDLKTPPKK